MSICCWCEPITQVSGWPAKTHTGSVAQLRGKLRGPALNVRPLPPGPASMIPPLPSCQYRPARQVYHLIFHIWYKYFTFSFLWCLLIDGGHFFFPAKNRKQILKMAVRGAGIAMLAVLMRLGCSEALAPAVLAPMRRTSAPRSASCLALRAQEAPARFLPPDPPPKEGDYLDMFCRGIIEQGRGDFYPSKNTRVATRVLAHRHQMFPLTDARAGTNSVMKTLVLQTFRDKVCCRVTRT